MGEGVSLPPAASRWPGQDGEKGPNPGCAVGCTGLLGTSPCHPWAPAELGLSVLRPLCCTEGVRGTVRLGLRCVFLGQCVFLGSGLTLCSYRR